MSKASGSRAKKKFNVIQPALTVTLRFNAAQRIAILKFIAMLNDSDDGAMDMQVAEFCKRAVFYSMNDAQRRAQKLAAKEGSTNVESAPTVPEGVMERIDISSDSAALADTAGN